MLLYGRILAIVRGKLVLLAAIVIFEAGSLICALANTIQLLIFGRVVAGAGAGGIYVAVLTILAQVRFLTVDDSSHSTLFADCPSGETTRVPWLVRGCFRDLQRDWPSPRRRFFRYALRQYLTVSCR